MENKPSKILNVESLSILLLETKFSDAKYLNNK